VYVSGWVGGWVRVAITGVNTKILFRLMPLRVGALILP